MLSFLKMCFSCQNVEHNKKKEISIDELIIKKPIKNENHLKKGRRNQRQDLSQVLEKNNSTENVMRTTFKESKEEEEINTRTNSNQNNFDVDIKPENKLSVNPQVATNKLSIQFCNIKFEKKKSFYCLKKMRAELMKDLF